MCGRYTWIKNSIGQFKKLVKEPDFSPAPSFNRAPSQTHPVISLDNGHVKWAKMTWGYQKTGKSKDFFPINARSETVAEKNIFKESFSKRRCLIPADGWFEWQVIEGTKYPHYLSPKQKEVFAFAGIWGQCSVDNSEKKVFSILTCNAPSNISHIHHRAPLALTENYWHTWLNGNHGSSILPSKFQPKQPRWEGIQVSARVNYTKNNDPALLEPFSGKQSLLF